MKEYRDAKAEEMLDLIIMAATPISCPLFFQDMNYL